MIITKLQQILQENQRIDRPLFLRNILKEVLQDYVLQFVYNHPRYKGLIFTGGTCLRKIHGLPRLSEDLDFDYEDDFELTEFVEEIKQHFSQSLQYKKLETKTSSRERTVYLKFPVLKELGIAKTSADSPILFLRCDFAPEEIGDFRTEINQISADEFTFFVRSYDLPTLFANKLIAFLEREFFKGKKQKTPFKGRDVFDLAWFLEQSARQNFTLQPNWERVLKGLEMTNRQEVWDKVLEKLEAIGPRALRRDLSPFIESTSTVDNFSENYFDVIKNKVEKLKRV